MMVIMEETMRMKSNYKLMMINLIVDGSKLHKELHSSTKISQQLEKKRKKKRS